jgi:hypothetical protein
LLCLSAFSFARWPEDHPLRAVVVNGGQGSACNIIGAVNPLLLGIILKKALLRLFGDGLDHGDPAFAQVAAEHEVSCQPIGRDVG